MAKQIINYGASANDGTGDPLRTAFIKTDNNFDQIWNAGPVGSNITILNNTVGVTNTNGNLILSPNGIGVIQTNSPLIPRLNNTNSLGTANLRYRSLYVGTGGINTTGNLTLANIANLHIPGGDNGYVIQTDGTGNLSWTAQTGSGNGNPGGADTQVQFNDGGLFAGALGFTFDKTSNTLSAVKINTTDVFNSDGIVLENSDLTQGATAAVVIPANGSTDPIQVNNTYSNIALQTGAGSGITASWSFNNDGSLKLPAGTITGAGNIIGPGNISYPYGPGVVVSANIDDVSGSYFTLQAIANVNGPMGYMGVASFGGNAVVGLVETNDGVGNTYDWYFQPDGRTSFPSYTFPNVDGIAGQVLSTDGNGEIYWGNGGSSNSFSSITMTSTPSGPSNIIQYGLGNLVAWLDGQWTIGEYNGTDYGTEGIRVSPGIEGDAELTLPANQFANTQPTSLSNYVGNVVILTGNNHQWKFDDTGNFVPPTQPSNQRTGTGLTLKIGDTNSQAIITGPAPVEGIYDNAPRLVVAGQDGVNNGEGGDIYLWAGKSGPNIGGQGGGDIKIDGGDAINGAEGGTIKIRGGYSYDGGSGQGTGGFIEIYAGGGGYGAPVDIRSGQGNSQANSASITLSTPYGGYWTFDNYGNLTLPQGGIVHETNIPFGGLSGKTIALVPSGGTNADQQLLVYPTAGPDANHLHLTSGNLYNTELFLGDDNLYVKLANTGNVVVNSNDGVGNTAQWAFDTNSTLTLPGGSRLRPLGANLDIFAGTGSYVNLITSDESSYMGVGGAGGYVVTAGGTWDFNTNGNLTAPGNVSAVGNITGGNIVTSGSGGDITMSGGDIIGAGNISATGNITASYFIGNLATPTYGSFYDTTTQTNSNVGNAIPIRYNTVDISTGVSIAGAGNTQITIAETGIYNIQFSLQVRKTDSGSDTVYVWLDKNGNRVTNSGTALFLSGSGAAEVAAWNFVVNAAANDYYRLMWMSTDSHVEIVAVTAGAVVPAIPSVILTVVPVGA